MVGHGATCLVSRLLSTDFLEGLSDVESTIGKSILWVSSLVSRLDTPGS